MSEANYGGLYLTVGDLKKLLVYHVQNLQRREDRRLKELAEYLGNTDETYLAQFQDLHHDRLVVVAKRLPTSSELAKENETLRHRVNFARALFISVLDQHAMMIRSNATLVATSA